MARYTVANITAQVETAGLKFVVREGKKKNENKYVVTDTKYNPVFGADKLTAIAEYLEARENEAQDQAEGLTDLSEVETVAQEMVEELEAAAGEEDITVHTYNGFDFEVICDRDGDYTFSVIEFETEIECLRPYATEHGILQHARNQIDSYKEWVDRCEEEAGGNWDQEDEQPVIAQPTSPYFTEPEALALDPNYTENAKITYGYGNPKARVLLKAYCQISSDVLEGWWFQACHFEPLPQVEEDLAVCVIDALGCPSELLNNRHPITAAQLSLAYDWRIIDPHQDPAPSCDIYEREQEAHQITVDRWHQVSIELGAINLGGESPNWKNMTMSDRLAYQERRLVNAQLRGSVLYRVHQSKIVYTAIKDTYKAITAKLFKEARTIWNLIPAELRKDAKEILNISRQDAMRHCNSFAEMVKATRLIDSLPH